ncbi:MAG: glycosyltransferase family 39 protein [Candidatus Woesearchaeota archaeon]
MSVQSHLRQNLTFYSVIFVAALARLLYLFDWHEIWWDSGVYFGMAKYLWSAGNSGLWEPIRPVLWPFVIGAGWVLNISIVWFARILEFLLSLISIALVYGIAKRVFSKRAAVVSSIIWAFSQILFYLGFHEYTEIPEITLVLAAALALISGRYWISGIFAGLAFLDKFPAGIFIVILGACIVFQKRWKKLVPLTIGFVLPVIPFLIFNKMMYGSLLKPVIEAHKSILLVVGCNILRYKPWYQYFGWILFDNILNAFAIVGIIAAVRSWKKQYILPALSVLIPLAYYLPLHCRDYRYLLLFLPFVVLFTGHGIDAVTGWLEKRKKIASYVWVVVLIVVFAVSASHAVIFYHSNEPRTPDPAAERYFKWLEGRHIDGEIWASNPVVAAYTDQKISKIYYPIYGRETAADFNRYLMENSEKVGAVLLDNCGGGLVCSPDDEQCPVEIEKMRAFLNENFRQVFFDQSGQCWYSIYAR